METKDNKISSLVEASLNEAMEALKQFMADGQNIAAIAEAASICANAISRGNKIMSCGNGGSLCDATHFAEELTGRFRNNRQPLPAVAINDFAHITCVGNDYSFSEIFSRYVEAVGCQGDVLVAISTSGNSENILRAVESAKAKNICVIGLTSASDNALRRASSVAICAPRTRYSDRIQEIHIKALHIMVQAIEQIIGCDKQQPQQTNDINHTTLKK